MKKNYEGTHLPRCATTSHSITRVGYINSHTILAMDSQPVRGKLILCLNKNKCKKCIYIFCINDCWVKYHIRAKSQLSS